MKNNKSIQSMLEHLTQESIHPEQIDLWPALRADLAARISSSNRPREFSMKQRIVLSASAAVLFAALLGFVLMRNVTPVSARTILDKAYAAQAESAPTQGIQHFRIEMFENIEAQAADHGTTMILESYSDLETGKFRVVTTEKNSGKVFYVAAYDGANSYNHDGGKPPVSFDIPLKIYRSPQDGPTLANQKLRQSGFGTEDAKAIFEKMQTDPNVQYTGQETWIDGRAVYVLRSNQEIKVVKNDEVEYPLGQVSVYFDASSYKLVGSMVTMDKDGDDLLITSQRILADEVLPADTTIAWDLSDLQGVEIIDDPDAEHGSLVVISVRELALKTDTAYLLKSIPEGFTLEISALPKQPGDEPYFYKATYRNKDGDYFSILVWPRAIGDTSGADEVYTTASGLVLHLEPQEGTTPAGTPHTFTSVLMETPEGQVYSINTGLPRETVKAWAEELVLVK